mmetsp:Transcript_17118/g.23536  ORF Transcript_17118/g.23536 Transcript_17118/m.23536 type:complete len:181 (+) Transcript_17118:18-560(+)
MSRDDDRGRGRDRDGPPNVDTMFTLKVDNISFRTTPESLREKFSPYGDIGDVYIPRNFGTNEPRGFAFVRFVDKRDAEDAQRALDGAEVDGREIRIQEMFAVLYKYYYEARFAESLLRPADFIAVDDDSVCDVIAGQGASTGEPQGPHGISRRVWRWSGFVSWSSRVLPRREGPRRLLPL